MVSQCPGLLGLGLGLEAKFYGLGLGLGLETSGLVNIPDSVTRVIGFLPANFQLATFST